MKKIWYYIISLVMLASIVGTTHAAEVSTTGEFSVNADCQLYQKDTIRFTDREPLIWHGQTITTSGTYQDKVPQPTGCDSIYELTAIRCTIYEIVQDTAICKNDLPYSWHGQLVYNEGTYEKLYTTEQGFDSIYRLNLTVYPAYNADYQINICPGEVVQFHGVPYSRPGKYQQIHSSIHGCDSVWNIFVNYKQTYFKSDSVGIRDEESYYWSLTDSTYAIPGTYELRRPNPEGCDSIDRLILYRYPKYLFTTDTAVCVTESAPYCTWREKQYFESGEYWDSLHTVIGQDSVYQLKLIIKKPTYGKDTLTFCGPTKDYPLPGYYPDTLLNVNAEGCDSIVMHLVKFNIEERYDTTTTSNGPYLWRGRELVESNDYKETTSANGKCDSTFILHLTLFYSINANYSDTVCASQLEANEPYMFDNKFPMYAHWNDKTRQYEDSVYWNREHTHWFRLHVLKPVYREKRLTFCENNVEPQLMHDGRLVTFPKSGSYFDTIPAHANGVTRSCNDTIVTYKVTIITADTIQKKINVKDLPYTWEGGIIEGPGYYSHRVQTTAGCDKVTVWAVSTLKNIEQTRCAGDSVLFGNKYVKDEGNYTHARAHESGLYEIEQLTLHIKQSSHQEIPVHISDQEDYTWVLYNADGSEHSRRTLPRTTGQYTDTVKNSQDCDSIITLKLTVHPTYNLHKTVTICESELPYMWENMQLWEAKDYVREYKTKTWNYDSICTLTLNVLPTYEKRLTYRTCQGEPIEVNHVIYSTPSLYYDTLKAINGGCDSVLIIDFKWYNKYVTPITAQCSDQECNENHPYEWKVGDKIIPIYHGGVYRDTLQSKHAECNCDSIVELTLTVCPTYHFDMPLSVCRNELPYEWHGKLLSETNIYTDTLTTKLGYDSIYTLYFTVLEPKESYIDTTTCYGNSITVNGHIYNKPGRYEDKSLKTTDNCDSTIIINFRWTNPYIKSISVNRSDKQLPYEWTVGDHQPRYLTHSGTYRDTLVSETTGCDSIIELTLSIYPTYHYEQTLSVCRNELPFEWHGKMLQVDSTYTDSLTTKQGYDSIYTIRFSVLESKEINIDTTVCYGESVEINSRRYDQPGIYRDASLKTSAGCDSILNIHLRWYNTYYKKEAVSCSTKDLPYKWHVNGKDSLLTHTGTFRKVMQSIHGCDSIEELVLTVHPTYEFKETKTVCSSELPFLWHNKQIDNAGDHKVGFHTTLGYDSIYYLHLDVLPVKTQTITLSMCQGETKSVNGKLYSKNGLYTDTLKTTNGCDSILTIQVKVYEPHNEVTNASTSNTVPYIWRGKPYSTAGTYTDHGGKMEDCDCNCDSVFTLNLRVYEKQILLSDPGRELCESEVPYMWRGHKCDTTGIYYDTIRSLTTDTIRSFKLKVNRFQHDTIRHLLCEGEEFTFNGLTIKNDTLYHDTIHTGIGCGTDYLIEIRHRQVTTKHFYERTDNQHPYLWEKSGKTYKLSGDYEYIELSEDGLCDSIRNILHLTVYPTYLIESEIETCDNEPIIWRGKQYNQTGIYYDSLLTNIAGYDSIYVLHLTVYPSYLIEESITVKEGQTTSLHGINITLPGVYNDTLYTKHGCDSIFKLTVNMTRSYRQEYNDVICNGESYSFGGKTYRKSGTLRDTIGIDSIVICHLEVLPSYYNEERKVLYPEQFPYLHNGELYYKEGIYDDTLQAVNGCDSIRRLYLVESKHCSNWDYVPLCTGETLYIDSTVITKIGSYSFLRRSLVTNQMDSLYLVQVYQASSHDMPAENYRICKGDTLDWNGNRYWRNGLYDLKMNTVEGCDSLVHLNLTVLPSYHFYTDALIADYETYSWRGNEYNTPGDYDVSYPTQEGCDSTYTLRLKVMETERIYTVDTICVGDTYMWQGKIVNQQGTYYDTLYLPGSFTSKIYILQLYETTPTIIRNARVGEICADADAFTIQFAYDGAKPARYSISFDQAAQRQGFENIYDAPYLGEINVPMPVHEKILYQGHPDYVRPDNYRLRLTVDNGICGLSKSDTLVLQVRYPSWIIEQSWTDVVSPLGKDVNGGYEFSQLEWYVNGSLFDTKGRDYIYSDDLKQDDKVVLRATRIGENYSIPSCTLVIEKLETTNRQYPTLLYPNKISRHTPQVTLEAQENGTWQVYSPTGMLCSSGQFSEGTQTIDMPSVNNCYLVRMVTESGHVNTQRIIIF